MKLLTIAIPIYNETSPVLPLVKKVVALDIKKEIIIIDDGSTLKATRSVLQSIKANYPQIKILTNKINMGKAYSIRLALSVAQGDFFVILDGDGELDPVGVKSLAKTMIATSSDFVNGTRVIKDLSKLNTRSNFISRVAKKLTTLAILIFYGIHIKDSLSGYKMFKTDTFNKFQIASNRFGLEIELLSLAIINNLSIKEVDVDYHPRTYKEGKKINMLDSIEMLRMLLRHSSLWHFASKFLISICIFAFSFIAFTHSISYFHTTDSLPVSLTSVNILYNSRLDLSNFKDILISKDLLGITVPGQNGQIFVKTPVILGYFSVLPFYLTNKYFHINSFDLAWIFDANYLQYIGKISAVFYISFSAVFMYWILRQISGSTKSSLVITTVYLFGTNIANTAAQANWQHALSLCFINLFLLIAISAKRNWVYVLLGLLMAVLSGIRITNIFYISFIPIYLLFSKHSWKDYITKNLIYFASFVIFSLVSSYILKSLGIPYGYSQEILYSLKEINIPLFFQNLSGILFSYNYGLFYYSPVLILIFFVKFPSSGLKYSLLPTFIAFPIFASIWWMWTGGMSLEARLLSELLPVIAILLVFTHQRFKHIFTYRLLFVLLFALSIYNNFLTTYMMDYSWHDLYLEHGGHHSQVHNAWVKNPTLLKYLADRRYVTIIRLSRENDKLIERTRVYRPSLKYFGFPKIFDTKRIII